MKSFLEYYIRPIDCTYRNSLGTFCAVYNIIITTVITFI